jgi:two-component system response regulator AtoC
MTRFKKEYGSTLNLPATTLRAFTDYSWPGNVRELENTLKRIVVLGNAEHIPPEIATSLAGGRTTMPAPGTVAAPPVADTMMGLKDVARRAARDAERLAIKEMLERVHWNRAKAARLLQISYKALLYKIVDCGLASPASEKDEELLAAS